MNYDDGRFLNLGCGTKILDGFENYDLYPLNKKVKFIELESIPYDFPDNCAKLILFSNVLEHLSVSKYRVLRELYRILNYNGMVVIRVPLYVNNIFHEKVFFTYDFFDPLCRFGYKDINQHDFRYKLINKYLVFNNDFEERMYRLLGFVPFFKRLRILVNAELVVELKKVHFDD